VQEHGAQIGMQPAAITYMFANQAGGTMMSKLPWTDTERIVTDISIADNSREDIKA
jgi:hypothetical protein